MADGQEYWMTNGACVPFVGDKPWYLPKEKAVKEKVAAKDKPVEKEKESPKEKAGHKAGHKDKK